MPDPHASWFQVAIGNVGTASNESLTTIRDKASQHEFSAAVRIGISKGASSAYFSTIVSALKTLESAGVRITCANEKPEAINEAQIPWHFPLHLSVKELASFFMLPIGDTAFAGAAGLHPKQILPPRWYEGSDDRAFATCGNVKLSISPKDALEHTLIIGPTGSGKSTVMKNQIIADMKAGRGVLVIDPKADLVNDIIACLPKEREDDLVILDPTNPCPVGFNPFAFKDYGDPMLIADAILSSFKEIFRDNWGIRSQDVLSAALLTLAQTEGASLLWLPTLLIDEDFRRKVTGGIRDKIGLEPYWEGFEDMKESGRRAEIAPVLNKIRQFLLRPGLRNVLGQSKPKFSLMDLFTKQKIVLVPLNKGTIGAESARLLGSLIVGMTWTLALSRANIPQSQRNMVSVYIDELQDYLALPTDLSDALAQARGLGVALTLAHQYRGQLPPEIRSGIDANARNKIVFGLNAEDAKAMAAMAPELDAVDFMSLPRYQIYASFNVDGRNTGWVSGKTLPPIAPTRDIVELRAKSMAAYGKPAEETESEYLALLKLTRAVAPTDEGFGSIGRRML
ncbi:MAG: type IV secretion system DNA-binding domain-containing protein [Bacteroidales bacterium]|nr:type IV secretion system DNA-binding domain-containing protein [Bacteroidales bacterium]